MIIKKGTVLEINSTRKGIYRAVLFEDFNEETDEFLNVQLLSKEIQGLSAIWETGNKIPCRKTLCTYKIIEKD